MLMLQTPSASASSQQVLIKICTKNSTNAAAAAVSAAFNAPCGAKRETAPVLVLWFGLRLRWTFLYLTVNTGEYDAGGSVTGGVCLHLVVYKSMLRTCE